MLVQVNAGITDFHIRRHAAMACIVNPNARLLIIKPTYDVASISVINPRRSKIQKRKISSLRVQPAARQNLVNGASGPVSYAAVDLLTETPEEEDNSAGAQACRMWNYRGRRNKFGWLVHQLCNGVYL